MTQTNQTFYSDWFENTGLTTKT